MTSEHAELQFMDNGIIVESYRSGDTIRIIFRHGELGKEMAEMVMPVRLAYKILSTLNNTLNDSSYG